MEKKMLPTGIENFYDIRTRGYYYIDKTNFIKELVQNGAYVTMFTRPRRFGKTLNMSMLRYFFEIGTDKNIFDGLAISKEWDICEKHMGQYPVISISLKDVDGLTYEDAVDGLWRIMSDKAKCFAMLQEEPGVLETDKEELTALFRKSGDLVGSLKFLSRLLYSYYGKKAVILIDEYDVPLDKAQQHGYYHEMVSLIRNLFNNALKTNEYMQFAVLTGCLRISKESIFTGLNNLSVNTIADPVFDEWFGFTDPEVRDILAYYGMEDRYNETRDWYDGYRFGENDVYCPWDVINWCNDLYRTRELQHPISPKNYWANTSSNDLIKQFAERSSVGTRRMIEQLIAGKTVTKKVKLDLTYPEINQNPENLWSILFTTGYLTQRSCHESNVFELAIPNQEIQSIFQEKIQEWFSEKTTHDTKGLQELIAALVAGDAQKVQGYLNDVMLSSVSFLDGGSLDVKENFYHGMLLGMLNTNQCWIVSSNREAGEGRADIIVELTEQRNGNYAIIIEVKYAPEYDELQSMAETALAQIEDRNYDAYFGIGCPEKITHYGIAFCRKRCLVLKK